MAHAFWPSDLRVGQAQVADRAQLVGGIAALPTGRVLASPGCSEPELGPSEPELGP
jgi:hypothetical protein